MHWILVLKFKVIKIKNSLCQSLVPPFKWSSGLWRPRHLLALILSACSTVSSSMTQQPYGVHVISLSRWVTNARWWQNPSTVSFLVFGYSSATWTEVVNPHLDVGMCEPKGHLTTLCAHPSTKGFIRLCHCQTLCLVLHVGWFQTAFMELWLLGQECEWWGWKWVMMRDPDF